ncbi:unnamed protein product [Cyprideis torosa]|uniref:Uncharacterized protein n=1 Tax=Cyprideis torosa TaxID=163714 RepID=A0A7R8W5B9_9CRUS|nr:unnamed protein product [Cyprideis torosa]CAG0885075.1 unnamed protein product [Cyprideis torosa]
MQMMWWHSVQDIQRLINRVSAARTIGVAWLRSVDIDELILSIHNIIITKNVRNSVDYDEESSSWNLRIKDAEKNDSGWYKCQINTVPMRSMGVYLNIDSASDLVDHNTSETELTVRKGNLEKTNAVNYTLCGTDIVAEDHFLFKQEAILKLLTRLEDPNGDAEQSKISRTYNPGTAEARYKDPRRVREFMAAFSSETFLKRGVYFSLFDEEHRNQMIQFFEILQGADSWDTFYRTACWGRDRLNEMLFDYALSVAVLHRKDTKGIALPPPYEVNPNFFVPTVAINEAYRGRMKGVNTTISFIFTGTQKNEEQKVAYFGEDIGLNSHHHYWHMEFPFWWTEQHGKKKDRKGELFFYMHHQLIARFDAERLSSDIPVVEPLSWNQRIKSGFAPMTSYKTEGDFPTRPDDVAFRDLPFLSIEEMRVFEERLHEAIDRGYLINREGVKVPLNIELLGDIIEASEYSLNPRFYGSVHNYAHMLISRINDPEGVFALPPGVMEHFSTATRDPNFFSLHKYIDSLFKKFKNNQPAYRKEDFEFPGVSIESLKVQSTSRAVPENQMITYFEEFEFNINNGMDVNPSDKNLHSKAQVQRLTKEAFKYVLEVFSFEPQSAVVRIFLVPKYNAFGEEHTQEEKRWSQIELDKFVVQLSAGQNTIVASSEDSSVTVPDRKGIDQLLQEIQDAKSGRSPLPVNKEHRHCGLPNRLLIPRGNTAGMDYELSVMITDWTKDKVGRSQLGGSVCYCGEPDQQYPDRRAMGFPFDKKAEVDAFDVANFKIQEVKIRFIP